MKISDLAAGEVTGQLNLLNQYNIWNSQLQALSEVHLMALYARLKSDHDRVSALNVFRLLKGEAMLRFMLGDLPHCAMIDFRPPLNDLVAPGLFPFLQSRPLNERIAILVALSEQIEVERVAGLTWAEVRMMAWTPFSKRMLERVVPRLGCPFVFWVENALGEPTSCEGIEQDLVDELGVSWSEFSSVTTTLLQFEHFAHPDIQKLLSA